MFWCLDLLPYQSSSREHQNSPPRPQTKRTVTTTICMRQCLAPPLPPPLHLLSLPVPDNGGEGMRTWGLFFWQSGEASILYANLPTRYPTLDDSRDRPLIRCDCVSLTSPSSHGTVRRQRKTLLVVEEYAEQTGGGRLRPGKQGAEPEFDFSSIQLGYLRTPSVSVEDCLRGAKPHTSEELG